MIIVVEAYYDSIVNVFSFSSQRKASEFIKMQKKENCFLMYQTKIDEPELTKEIE